MPHRRTLDDDAIRLILTSPVSHNTLAQQIGVHRSTISQVRLGRIYANALPDLPRWLPNLNCGHCNHWQHNRCSLDLPEPAIEGLNFARECSTFTHRR